MFICLIPLPHLLYMYMYLFTTRRGGEGEPEIKLAAVPDGRCHGHFPEIWQFSKLNVRGKLVAVKVAVSHAIRHQLVTPQQQQESKQQQECWQQQGSQQQQQQQERQLSISTAKMPATAGSVWKSYKSGRK